MKWRGTLHVLLISLRPLADHYLRDSLVVEKNPSRINFRPCSREYNCVFLWLRLYAQPCQMHVCLACGRMVVGSIIGSGNILLSWNHFYGHSLPTADSSRAVVSYWRKDVHLVVVNRLGRLPRNSAVRLTDSFAMTIVVDWDVKPQIKQTAQNREKSASFGRLFLPNHH